MSLAAILSPWPRRRAFNYIKVFGAGLLALSWGNWSPEGVAQDGRLPGTACPACPPPAWEGGNSIIIHRRVLHPCEHPCEHPSKHPPAWQWGTPAKVGPPLPSDRDKLLCCLHLPSPSHPQRSNAAQGRGGRCCPPFCMALGRLWGAEAQPQPGGTSLPLPSSRTSGISRAYSPPLGKTGRLRPGAAPEPGTGGRGWRGARAARAVGL